MSTLMTTETTTDQTVEAKGSSLDEATQSAAALLGVTPDQVEVLKSETQAGLFGRVEHRVVARALADKTKKPRARKAAVEASAEEPEAPVEPAPKAKAAPRRKTAKAEPAEPAPAEDAEGGEDAVASPEAAQRYVELIEELLELSGLDVTAKVASLNGRYANIELDGADASYLVGRKGEVLNAFQYILNVIGVIKFGEGVRVSLEADDYRKRRAEVLEKLASDIAKEVIARGEEAVLDALPAFERRIVHQALSEIEGVTTYSEGEEPERRVVIAPAE
jgi:spoIIIJ-associated protein